jgi:hypothetical protein
MNPADVARQGLEEGEIVGLTTAIEDGIRRRVGGFIVRGYNIPEGCLAAYYPECNPLVPVSHHAKGSFVPAVKGVPVRIEKTGARLARQRVRKTLRRPGQRRPGAVDGDASRSVPAACLRPRAGWGTPPRFPPQ